MGGAGISQKRFCLIIYLQYLSLSFTISKNYVDDAIVLGENGGGKNQTKENGKYKHRRGKWKKWANKKNVK